MKANIDKYFISANAVDDIPESHYQKLEPVLQTIEAFTRNTNKVVYMVDYLKKNFLYSSANIEDLCGITKEEMVEMGYLFHFQYVPRKEQQMLLELNKAGFEFYENLPKNERDGYSISYDFHVMKGDRVTMIHHDLTYLVTTRKGRILLALCTMSPSSSMTPGNIIMRKEGCRTIHEYNLETHEWIERKLPKINATEKTILTRLMQGYTMEEISNNEGVSLNTLKASKRLLFQKLNVNNISQAIAYCMNYKLL
ncbi:helix-turn-helix transcriptional regulator [Prevotella sp.]|uniref:helix-turn-helix transcriptional regulator n=1 Tax=Prevotella sp. TaxID=59823 RepID=UPI002A82FC49|nr:helix-turn-helix transcriptional regulator [Prevotella sp.]MCI6491042.1 helix-turn-helix transcriptional regulator [Prevotella sp.]MDY4644637.1 helix-turn-helix transcriptional regulator [Prevotella sp.]